MEYNEHYEGVAIGVHTSELASGRVAFAVYLDGRLMTAEIDGLDAAKTIDIAVKKAKAHVDRRSA